MGSVFANDLSSMDNITIEQQIAIHLSSNFYPPVPSSMIAPCLVAIEKYWEDEQNYPITLPKGVLWRGQTAAPAYAILEQHKLYPWIQEGDEE
jgi:hypothetical protein